MLISKEMLSNGGDLIKPSRFLMPSYFLHDLYFYRWRARVVYGDTDSVFVHVEGRTLKQAFEIGREIANEISSINPWYFLISCMVNESTV